MKRHKLKHVNDRNEKNKLMKLYSCPRCGYHTRRIDTFKEHLKSKRHIEKANRKPEDVKNVKLRVCNICNYMTSDKSNFKRHINNVHTSKEEAENKRFIEIMTGKKRGYNHYFGAKQAKDKNFNKFLNLSNESVHNWPLKLKYIERAEANRKDVNKYADIYHKYLVEQMNKS
jgi:hypothetical protein